MPDPGSLRSCAQVLEIRADEFERARTGVQGSLRRTTWVAASADRQRAHLAGVDARARTGVDELRPQRRTCAGWPGPSRPSKH